jgi:hypothetical protein
VPCFRTEAPSGSSGRLNIFLISNFFWVAVGYLHQAKCCLEATQSVAPVVHLWVEVLAIETSTNPYVLHPTDPAHFTAGNMSWKSLHRFWPTEGQRIVNLGKGHTLICCICALESYEAVTTSVEDVMILIYLDCCNGFFLKKRSQQVSIESLEMGKMG